MEANHAMEGNHSLGTGYHHGAEPGVTGESVDQINIIDRRLPDEMVHPCDLGLHLWALLTRGGQACHRCGVAR